MKTRTFLLLAMCASLMLSASAASHAADAPDSSEKRERKSNVKEELKSHFNIYGFIRNYFTFDSRESASGTGNLFYYLPFDHDYNELGEDLNASPSFRFLSITSRVGLDVLGYRIGRTDISAKVETDFYAGLSGSTGTATLLLAGKGKSKLPATEENPQRDSIITSWSTMDLSGLGNIDYIDFDLSFSDTQDEGLFRYTDVCIDKLTATVNINTMD